MDNKKIIIGVGVVALLGVVYYMMKKKKVAGTSMEEIVTAIVPIAPYTIQWKADPTGAVFVVIDGKKYGFVSEKAFTAYGYSTPKSVTKEEVDAIPIGGFVSEEGKVIQNSTALTRAQMQDEIYQANLWRTGGTDKNFSRASYDRINDADLAMIYDVDVKKITVTPAYITMLKKYGWA